MGDRNDFQVRFIELRRAMLDDGVSMQLPIHHQDIRQLELRVQAEGFSFIQVTLPSLGRALDTALTLGQLTVPKGFAVMKGTRLPRLLHNCFKLVFEDDGRLREAPVIHCIRFLRQFLLFDAKLITEPTHQQEEQAVSGFEDRQRKLRGIRLDLTNPILRKARAFLGEVIRDWDLSNIHPGHGPGAVAEGSNHEEKWIFPYWPKMANKFYNYYSYACTSSIESQWAKAFLPLVSQPETRICLVPKDFRGPRLISAESAATQYLQQGQMRRLMDLIDSSVYLRHSIRLRDQTFNQFGAARAWQDGFVTLDLSDASDTVSCPLVWYLFSTNRLLRSQLFSTRSYYAVWKDRKIRLSAFAPMGSAVCFPVETLVFWALSTASIAHVYNLDLVEASRMTKVFGDDIIVPEGLGFESLVECLRVVGCKPNTTKTCYMTPFRESCGTEWFKGVPVTIHRNRSYPYGKLHLVHYNVLLHLQRNFFAGDYKETARVLHDWSSRLSRTVVCCRPSVKDGIGEVVEWVDSYSYLDYSAQQKVSSGDSRARLCLARLRDDLRFDFAYGESDQFPDRLRVRWNRSLQRHEYLAPIASVKRKDWAISDQPRLTARLVGDQTERVASRDLTVKLAWRYLPAYAGVNQLRLVI